MKILVADDHPLVRGGLRAALTDMEDGVEVIEARDFDETYQAVENNLDLDLVLLDLTMPGATGMSGLQRLRADFPATPVAVLSGAEEARHVRAALDLGAAGFIPKSSPNTVMISAIRLIRAGGVYVPPAVLGDVDDGAAGAERHRGGGSPLSSLTDRQTEVLRRMCEGKSNKEIARDLDIAESTVKAHVSVILKVLDVPSRAKAILAAERFLSA